MLDAAAERTSPGLVWGDVSGLREPLRSKSDTARL